eukprot:CAMPEP_0176479994 /NCGR_PEP_ID=MMETSP0200_2-20121128/2042_1 /TAXON_ID=947934 /ORGANISM="Chaetoceros sp., Strain GSL56" /LENGTH=346 /DNA_ID=CAMNT_0017876087 /DNA_START=144 /DNA_END=1181 /DNA_ORIENTATION=+
MIVSCALLPSFDAGNDVQVFDMRLNLVGESLGTKHKQYTHSLCFCLQGHACEILYSPSISKNWQGIIDHENVAKKKNSRQRNDKLHPKCMDIKEHKVSSRTINIYDKLLSPFTRWDAARFLTIAVDPRGRYPQRCLDKNLQDIDLKQDDTCQVRYDDDDVFASSEQAHAFFPFFPLILRYLSLLLARVIPDSFLPPTFEALVVFSGVLWNAIAFTVSAVAFHNLTRLIVSTPWRKNERMHGTTFQSDDAVRIANLATVLYCLNPANIFFVTCYSESTFSLFTFCGYYFFHKSQQYTTSGGILYRLAWLWCSTISWVLASYTRSNGSLISIFIFIHLCGIIVNNHYW